MAVYRRRRKKETRRELRLFKVYERAHTRMRVIAYGIGEELKHSYDAAEVLKALDIAATDLMGSARAEQDAYKAWQAAIPPRKNPRATIVRNPRRPKRKARKIRAGGKA